eukprot:1156732-Pelagomonas_calceolata.AAC.2
MNLGLTKHKAKLLASKLRNHTIQRLTTIINTRHALCLHEGFWGGVLGAQWWRTGEGESGRPGAWRATLQISIISFSGSEPVSPRIAVSSVGLEGLLPEPVKW